MRPWLRAFKDVLKRPAFVLAALVLLFGAVGLNGATIWLKWHFRKEAMALRSPEGLGALPKELGTWVSVPDQHSIDPEMVHNLGTDKYVFREYINTAARVKTTSEQTIASRSEVLGLADLSANDRFKKVNEYRRTKQTAVISLAITYYTGKVDTVPHVPDRCYVADGFQPSSYKLEKWKLGSAGVERDVPVRFIDFEDQTARGALNRCVAYFFHANGDYEENPNMVRAKLQDLRERCAYFAKIEVMMVLAPRTGLLETDTLRERDRKEAAQAMQDFLQHALPEVEKLLPDWKARPR